MVLTASYIYTRKFIYLFEILATFSKHTISFKIINQQNVALPFNNIDYVNGTAAVESNGSRQNIQLRLIYSFGSKFGKKKAKRNANREEENRINLDN